MSNEPKLELFFDFSKKYMNNELVTKEYVTDFLLMELFSPAVLKAAKAQWDTLPDYVQKSLDKEIIDLIQSDTEPSYTEINRYWINRAVRVLQGYSNCPIPLTRDKRLHPFQKDLLSEKGHQLLRILKHAVTTNRATGKPAELARSATQKAVLDLNLFIDLELSNLLERGPAWPLAYNEIEISMSTGCYNHCVHCGYEAKAPVFHMPYPLFLKLFQKHAESGRILGGVDIYNNSDPMSYYDPIINADAGDVVLALPRLMGERRLNVSFLTKGVLTKQDETTFARVVYHHLRWPNDCRLGIELSYVDLPGEAVAKNKERIKHTAQIYRDISNKNPRIRHYHLPNTPTITEAEFGLPPANPDDWYHTIDSHTDMQRVGRWADAAERLSPADKIAVEQTKEKNFTSDCYAITADLMLYDVKKQGNKFVWRPMGSILDTPFMRQLQIPQPDLLSLIKANTAPHPQVQRERET